MRKSEKRMVVAEVLKGVCFLAMFFLLFWGHAQLIDPDKIFMISKVPWEIALTISIFVVIGSLLSEKIASKKEQTLKQIKKGNVVQWTN
jgi:hypothetical protein